MKRLVFATLALAPLTGFALINFDNQVSDNIDVDSLVFNDGPNQVVFSFSSSEPIIEDANNGEYYENLSVEGPTETGDGLPPPDPYGFLTTADGDGSLILSDKTAVGYAGSTWVQQNSGPDLGTNFLRGSFLNNTENFTVDFVNGTSTNKVSFQIWDIDGGASGTEKYQVLFYDGNTLLHTINTPEFGNQGVGTSLDGLPYLVAYDAGNLLIDRVEVMFTGTKTTNIGLAFDNFDTENVPEPSTYAMLAGIAALGLALLRRRR